MKAKIGAVAFWKYDIYPYTSYGTITKVHRRYGFVDIESKEYGNGFYFRPFMILSEEDAKPIIEKLKELKAGRLQLIDIITISYETMLKDLIPGHPRFNKLDNKLSDNK